MNKKWDKRFLGLAQYISNWSLDPSTKVGAVIVDQNNRIVSMGYNGFAKGVKDTDERLNNRDLKYKMIIHAEQNAIVFAQRDLTDCKIYTYPFMPCASCASLVAQAGIKQVISCPNDNPRWQQDFELAKEMFNEASIELSLFSIEQ